MIGAARTVMVGAMDATAFGSAALSAGSAKRPNILKWGCSWREGHTKRVRDNKEAFRGHLNPRNAKVKNEGTCVYPLAHAWLPRRGQQGRCLHTIWN